MVRSLRKCEFKTILTVRHGRKPIVLGEHQCARDRLVGHTVYRGAVDAVAIFRLRVLSAHYPRSGSRQKAR